MSKFDNEAREFARKFGLNMKCSFMGHARHFHLDDNTRDRWRITLSREGRFMVVEFGQSLAESCFCKDSEGKYWHNNGNSNGVVKPQTPQLYDVISTIQKWEVGTFRSWCKEMGHDTDSRSALDTYLRTQNEYEDWCRLCNGLVMLEESREIQ